MAAHLGHFAAFSCLPNTFEAVACRAPTRAHPLHTTTPCHYISYGPSPRPCGPPRRRLGWGGPSKCSGTGRLGGRGGPLWVPSLTTRSSMHHPEKRSGRELHPSTPHSPLRITRPSACLRGFSIP